MKQKSTEEESSSMLLWQLVAAGLLCFGTIIICAIILGMMGVEPPAMMLP